MSSFKIIKQFQFDSTGKFLAISDGASVGIFDCKEGKLQHFFEMENYTFVFKSKSSTSQRSSTSSTSSKSSASTSSSSLAISYWEGLHPYPIGNSFPQYFPVHDSSRRLDRIAKNQLTSQMQFTPLHQFLVEGSIYSKYACTDSHMVYLPNPGEVRMIEISSGKELWTETLDSWNKPSLLPLSEVSIVCTSSSIKFLDKSGKKLSKKEIHEPYTSGVVVDPAEKILAHYADLYDGGASLKIWQIEMGDPNFEPKKIETLEHGQSITKFQFTNLGGFLCSYCPAENVLVMWEKVEENDKISWIPLWRLGGQFWACYSSFVANWQKCNKGNDYTV